MRVFRFFLKFIVISLYFTNVIGFKLAKKLAICTLSLGLSFSGPFNYNDNVVRAADLTMDANDIRRLKVGLSTINILLKDWTEKTTYCNFGEVKREMMADGNEATLLKEAAAGGLLDYDKSATMNVMCKRDPQIVRAYLGLEPSTGNNLFLKQ